MNELLDTAVSIEAFSDGIWIVVSDHEETGFYDVTFRNGEAIPPFRTFKRHLLTDVKFILQAQGFNHTQLHWQAVEEDEGN